jgi:hypothetical protein
MSVNFRTCNRCGKTQALTELAFLDDVAYCHPSMSTGDTCYVLTCQAVARLWRWKR